MNKFLAFVLLLTTAALAKTLHAPLPDAVTKAKTIYIDNQSGSQGVVDGAYTEFSKWGRFTVVSDKSAADLIATFTYNSSLYEGTTRSSLTMTVTPNNSTDSLFQDTERWTIFSNGSKSCVKSFADRVNSH
ncbi:MAG: hypothetical protein ABSA39_06795 [Edaphobacter sp.]